ncbi:MAG: CDC48 family AAA ATPase [Deltaproteobacteria bacterium]|nr:CDC48 family AAA ATPase [Deltaproteobacteria bacterium]
MPQSAEGRSVSLRVAEALPKDVGRGIARIDPEDLRTLGAEVGDIVEIQGKRRTVAKVMPAYMEARGKRTIQIDGLIRANALVGLDERVKVQTVAARPATRLVLSPLSPMRAPQQERDSRYLGRLLEGLPAVVGDRVRAIPFGTMVQEFTVVDAAPAGAVIIQPTTLLRVQQPAAPAEPAKVSYEDIGGLAKEIQRVREMIELPLKYPEVFERLGISAPKGVLLHGPPGCGKTLIARAVAHETDAHFLAVSGPEVIHKFYGESEAKLRKLFEEAERHAPSIIFLDEIDALAPKREAVVGEVEKRVVAQLLALLDGLRSRGQVIVIGATNLPNALDPALRRPGRFDREITIGIPDKRGRRAILEIHTRGMPLADEVDLEELAEITHGYVGADLEALCREAAMAALRALLPQIEFEVGSIPYETVMELRIGREHFLQALNEVEPSALREITVEVPDVRWQEVGGLEPVKQALQEALEWPLKYSLLFQHAGASPPKGILLYGSPGTGKTLLARAAATESQANFIAVKGPALLSKWVGESEKGVREVFKRAKQAAPCLVFFDEIDALAPVRAGSGDARVSERIVSQLLTELDGIEELRGVVVLGATNRLDMVDPALLRAGRFDAVIQVPLPDEQARLAIFRIHTQGKPLAPDVELARLARESDGCSGAEIAGICHKATMLAIREYLERHPWGSDPDFKGYALAASHLDQALRSMRGSGGVE